MYAKVNGRVVKAKSLRRAYPRKTKSFRLPLWLIDKLETLPNQTKAIEDALIAHFEWVEPEPPTN